MNVASPPPAKNGLSFRLHDDTTATLRTPRRNLMIVIGGILAVLVLATTGKAFFATSMPATVLYLADDPVALVATARDEFELTQREREFADKLPDERLAAGGGDTLQSRPRRKPTLTMDQIGTRARRALLFDNLSADAFDLMARVAAAQDQPDLAGTYADAASRLSLHETASNLLRASRALREGNYAAAAQTLDTQMRSQLASTNQIAPTLLKIAEDPEGLKQVVNVLSQAPPWRDTFMLALPRSMTNAITPLEIIRGLAATPLPASRANIAAYLDELIRRKEYDAARYGYLQLLPSDQLADVGLISNANFDKPPFGGPFDWHIKRGSGVKAEIVSQQDRPKDRALLLQFGSGRTSFTVLQYLMLTPGRYNFSVEAQGELTGPRGLVWRLICADDKRKLGETPMFLGQAESWIEMPAVFFVPADCPVQIITLLLDARAPSEQMASGTVWYDNMKIAKAELPATGSTSVNARPANGN